MEKQKLSIIITAYDKHEITKAHVRESMNSTIVPDEIIVVNDGGDPYLKDMLKTLDKKCDLIYARINEDIPWNYHGACNLGVWLSRGDIIGFEDNDNIPTPTFYEEALKVLNERSDVGRVIGKIRYHISISELEKSAKDWVITGNRGPNQGSYLMRRDIYLKLKGQDERFCGRYGWMYYDWRRKLLQITTFANVGAFYYVLEGQSNLLHKNSSVNFGFLRDNTHNKRLQSPIGMLNFTYEVEHL